MPSLRAIAANSIIRSIITSGFFTGGRKAFDIAPKLPKKVPRGAVYITAKNVPPNTIKIDATSMNAPSPPPESIAPTIIPTAPIRPMREARSILSTFLSNSPHHLQFPYQV